MILANTRIKSSQDVAVDVLQNRNSPANFTPIISYLNIRILIK